MAFWRKTQTIDSELLKILAHVDGVSETWLGSASWSSRGLVPISAGAGTNFLEETIKKNGPWEILLKVARNTEDGQLTTSVYSAPNRATVEVTLSNNAGVLTLSSLEYTSETNNASRHYVREWVLNRAMPELEAANARFVSDIQRQAAELDAMRKKHLS